MPRRLTATDLARAEQARLNLIRFRNELGLTAAHVAARAQIPLDSYRQFERGTRRLTNISIIIDLAKATGHLVDDFFSADPPAHDPDRLAIVGASVLPGAELDDDLWQQIASAIDAAEAEQRRRNARKRTSS